MKVEYVHRDSSEYDFRNILTPEHEEIVDILDKCSNRHNECGTLTNCTPCPYTKKCQQCYDKHCTDDKINCKAKALIEKRIVKFEKLGYRG